MPTPRTLAFSKLEATGNDFVFIRADESTAFVRSALARDICHRNLGVGADGLVFVRESSPLNWEWDFYNQDGSHAEMCGNAARCMAKWLEAKQGQSRGSFETKIGTIKFENHSGQALVEIRWDRQTAIEVQTPVAKGFFINTGVPHVVCLVDQVSDKDSLMPIVREFRWHSVGGERGANVTFLTPQRGTITFERGVEGFTLSCGTGVMAAAVVSLHGQVGRTHLYAPGGTLEVEIADLDTHKAAIRLTGPARFVFEGQFIYEEKNA